jgi:hypothetical protein
VIIPDVTGYHLNEAENKLRENGIIHIDVITTAPPKAGEVSLNKNTRVVRQKVDVDAKTAVLTVCSFE